MAAFRRVEDRQAGPTAVGILVPPGLRTMVIVRPRALPWDLLAVRPEDAHADRPTFCSFDRDDAALLARRLKSDLDQAGPERAAAVEVCANPWGGGHVVWLRCAGFLWIPCLRRPGQPYQGSSFPGEDETREAARQIARYLCPGPDDNQEVYFNTQHFHQ